MVTAGFLLKELAHEYNISVVVTNHMVAGEAGISKPALGESWKSISHVRLLLSRNHATNGSCITILKHPCLYGDKEIDERGFKSVIQEGMKLATLPNLGDYFPFLGILDLQGLTKKMKALAKVFNDFFEKVIDDHVRSDGDHGETKDIVDTMMSIMRAGDTEFQFDRRHVKAIMLDMLAASMDTAASTIEWLISELLKNPRIMKKVQKELEEVVGMKRMVEESDLDGLEYLEMVVKETFRLHPVAPLLLPTVSHTSNPSTLCPT